MCLYSGVKWPVENLFTGNYSIGVSTNTDLAKPYDRRVRTRKDAGKCTQSVNPPRAEVSWSHSFGSSLRLVHSNKKFDTVFLEGEHEQCFSCSGRPHVSLLVNQRAQASTSCFFMRFTKRCVRSKKMSTPGERRMNARGRACSWAPRRDRCTEARPDGEKLAEPQLHLVALLGAECRFLLLLARSLLLEERACSL